MGTEAVWVPLVAAAIGGTASYVNTTRTAKRQDNTLAEGIREKSRRQQQADAKVNELIQKTGESNPEAEKANAMAKYMQALKGGNPLAASSFGNVSGASDTYKGDANAAALGSQGYAQKVADILSRLDGPMAQRRREGNDQANFGVAIDQIKRFAEGDDFLNRIKLQGIRRNPMLDAFAAAANSYGSAYASGGYGGAGAGTGQIGTTSGMGDIFGVP